jgi:hypothetical protein
MCFRTYLPLRSPLPEFDYFLRICRYYTFHELGPLACFCSELTSETLSHFRQFGRTPWTRDQPNARPLPTQDSTTEKNVDIICSSTGIRMHDPGIRAVQDQTRLRWRSHRDQLSRDYKFEIFNGNFNVKRLHSVTDCSAACI